MVLDHRFGKVKPIGSSTLQQYEARGEEPPKPCSTFGVSGQLLTVNDLPSADTRWVATRKANVLALLHSGVVSREEIIERCEISDQELADWEVAFDRDGLNGLKVTKFDDQLAEATNLQAEEATSSVRVQRPRSVGKMTYHKAYLDCDGQRLGVEGGRAVQLTRLETELLKLLFEAKDNPSSKQRIHYGLYGPNGGAEIKIVDVVICKLRKKIIALDDMLKIETVWGRGYRLAVDS